MLGWLKRIRSRPAVERGLAVGVPKEEIDQWSAARKKAVMAGGAKFVTPVRV